MSQERREGSTGHPSCSNQQAWETGASFPRNLGFPIGDDRVRIEGCYQKAEWSSPATSNQSSGPTEPASKYLLNATPLHSHGHLLRPLSSLIQALPAAPPPPAFPLRSHGLLFKDQAQRLLTQMPLLPPCPSVSFSSRP